MSKKPTDANQLAKSIIDAVTRVVESADKTEKNPAAVELGRRGGLKGGKARAEKLSKLQRVKIAKKAAKARWASKKP